MTGDEFPKGREQSVEAWVRLGASHLLGGVRAGPALLDEAFAKGQELEAVQLHVVRQSLGHLVGTLDDSLALPRHGEVSWGQSSPAGLQGHVQKA